MRIEGYPCFHPLCFNCLYSAMQVRTRLVMHSENISTELSKSVNIAVGVNNHQVNI